MSQILTPSSEMIIEAILSGEPGLYRLAGPPGTGKTTTVIRLIEESIRRGIYQPEDITVLSFTRVAAYEVKSRLKRSGIVIPEKHVGTLHGMAYQQLRIEAPELQIAVKPEILSLWNRTARDEWMVPPDFMETGTGNSVLNRYLWLRAQYAHPDVLRQEGLDEFAQAWELFKRVNHVVDFSDMIELAITRTIPPALGLLVADEGQDLSPQEARLVQAWGECCDRYVKVGDDDQSIYSSLKGATASIFLTPPLPAGREFVLSQSYRIPRAVHQTATRIIEGVTDERWIKGYFPREDEGVSDTFEVTYEDGDALVDYVLHTSEPYGSVMILTYAHYMLETIIQALREQGVPYHNPYRPSSREWNPLGVERTGAMTLFQRLQRFVQKDWTIKDALDWMKPLKVSQFSKRGLKSDLEKKLKAEEGDEPFPQEWFARFQPEHRQQIEERSLQWYREMHGEKAPALEYAIKVLEKDPEARTPKIVIGTIHSVKGAEADFVFLCPDYPRDANTNEALRTLYVGATRARQHLTLGAGATEFALRGHLRK